MTADHHRLRYQSRALPLRYLWFSALGSSCNGLKEVPHNRLPSRYLRCLRSVPCRPYRALTSGTSSSMEESPATGSLALAFRCYMKPLLRGRIPPSGWVAAASICRVPDFVVRVQLHALHRLTPGFAVSLIANRLCSRSA